MSDPETSAPAAPTYIASIWAGCAGFTILYVDSRCLEIAKRYGYQISVANGVSL